MQLVSFLVCLIMCCTLACISAQKTVLDHGCTLKDPSDSGATYYVSLTEGRDNEASCRQQQVVDGQMEHYKEQVARITNRVEELKQLKSLLENRTQALQHQIARATWKVKNIKESAKAKDKVRTACPAGFTIRNEHYNSCYMLVGVYLTWFDAESYCYSNGAHLVAFETADELDYIMGEIDSQSSTENHQWTGGNDIAAEGEWVWAGVNEPFNYTRWLLYPHAEDGLIQMPDDDEGNEHCVHLFHLHDYQWNDLQCTLEHHSICESKILGT